MNHSNLGQMHLPFGMIFSIILIAIFLIFGFYSIKTFIKIQNSALLGKFFSDIQYDINKAWRSAESSQLREYIIPSKVRYVCFVDFNSSSRGAYSPIFSEISKERKNNENLFSYPQRLFSVESKEIENIDLIKITSEENPFCLEQKGGRIKLILRKNFEDLLVGVERVE
ncbi:MAG: hypothetical protein QXU40_00670 [Candidatus Pacearchaeota archaeon]